MKLGTQTGSLTNHILSRAVVGQPEPTVGMGATVLLWTDSHAATITAIEGNVIAVQEDKAKRTDSNGLSESQSYTYERNPNGHKLYFRRAANGMWHEVRRNDRTGRWNKVQGHGLRIGERREYRDPSF